MIQLELIKLLKLIYQLITEFRYSPSYTSILSPSVDNKKMHGKDNTKISKKLQTDFHNI